MMNILLLLCLLSSLVTLLNSSICSRITKPRTEGFLRTQCFPGFYKGSCLIIVKEKLSFRDAIETCRYYHGGRLATAPRSKVFRLWAQTVYFNHHGTDGNARYWIGYGKNEKFNFEEPNAKMEKYINRGAWDRVFGIAGYGDAVVHWESGANKDLLNSDSDCPNYGAVFNPTNLKFDARKYDEKHYALCETPRWAKLQCNTNWHLIPQIRMCVKVHTECVKFHSAAAACRADASHILVVRDVKELEMQRDVINQYNLENKCSRLESSVNQKGGFWNGIRSLGKESFAIDGTKSEILIKSDDPNENNCQAQYYSNDPQGYIGLSFKCREPATLPYMCQRFADQSLQVNVA